MRDQRAEIGGCRQGGDEGFRVSAALVQIAPVLCRESGAQLPQRRAQRWIRFRLWHTSLPCYGNTRMQAIRTTDSGGKSYSIGFSAGVLCVRNSRALT